MWTRTGARRHYCGESRHSGSSFMRLMNETASKLWLNMVAWPGQRHDSRQYIMCYVIHDWLSVDDPSQLGRRHLGRVSRRCSTAGGRWRCVAGDYPAMVDLCRKTSSMPHTKATDLSSSPPRGHIVNVRSVNSISVVFEGNTEHGVGRQ